jgi:PncC family amidohydrolase
VNGDSQQSLASAVAEGAQRGGHTIAAAESVTAGSVATALAAGAEASEWFKGSIVAYQTALKRDLLGVTEERVITPECAVQMMLGALTVTGADLAVSITGVGGPDPEEQQPPGTVFTCAGSRSRHSVLEHHFEGPPVTIVALATTAALRHLRTAVEGAAADG